MLGIKVVCVCVCMCVRPGAKEINEIKKEGWGIRPSTNACFFACARQGGNY